MISYKIWKILNSKAYVAPGVSDKQLGICSKLYLWMTLYTYKVIILPVYND